MTELLAQHAAIGALAAKQIFFVGGSVKSGTTWLQRLLDAHPAVACKGESHSADHLARLLMQALDKHNQFLGQKNAAMAAAGAGFPLYNRDDLAYLVAAALLLGLGKAPDAKTLAAIGEKTPDNVRYFDVLHAIFGTAKFLHLVRDGRDCAVSGWFHIRRASPDWAAARHPEFAAYVEMFAAEWAKDLAQADAFAQAHPGACLAVRYEDLVAETPATLSRILDFLGVASDAATIAASCEAAAFERLSGGRAPGEENRASFYRRGQPGDWRRHLTGDLPHSFARIAAPWLERFGYA